MKWILGFAIFLFSCGPGSVLGADPTDICFQCEGSTAKGGPCYAGKGGPRYPGPGGPCYAGKGGPLYAGKGGPRYSGKGGPRYAGKGGPCYAGKGGPCSMYQEKADFEKNCPAICGS